MPTAIEYGLTNHWHTQNGAGSGPPADNFSLAQNGAGTGPPNHNDAAVLVPQPLPAGELLLAGPLVSLLLAAVVMVAIRRRTRNVAT